MSDASFIQSLLRELMAALVPVERLRASPGEATMFLTNNGWPPPAGFDPSGLLTPFDISTELASAQVLVAQLQEDDANFIELIPQLQNALSAIIDKIRFATDPGGLPAPYDTAAFWTSFTEELFNYLLLEHIEARLPVITALFQFVGVILEQDVPSNGTRADYIRRTIEWENLGRLFTQPDQLLRETYDWGSVPFNHDRLLRNLHRLLGTLHRFDISYSRSTLLDSYYSPNNPNRGMIRELYGPLLEGVDTPTGSRFSLIVSALPIPPLGDLDGAPVGLVLGTSTSGVVDAEIDFGLFDIYVKGGFETASGPRIEIRPDSVAFVIGSSPPTYNAGVGVAIGSNEPIVLIGSQGSHRLQIGRFASELQLSGTPSDSELIVRVTLTDLEIVMQMTEGDGFLQKVFGSKPQSASTSVMIEWSTKYGLSFVGGASLGVTIALHLEWGPIRLDELSIDLAAASNQPFSIGLGVTAGLMLGPLNVTVKRMGIRALLEQRADGSGTFGNVDLGFGFLPPTGAGLSLDTGFIVGGGYLEIDNVNKRYAGILQLKIGDIGIVAIGLIATRMPDGSKGFSLLINIGVTFSPPIQLSFGFVLAGVGGLLGYNRTMLTDVLRDGLKNKTLDSILFPEDPIANASKIISDLRSVFPVTEGQFVIGPMIKLGWGSPPLITVDIGIFIEFPSPVRIVLLGQVAATFPSPDLIIVEIHIDVLGIIDFGKKELSIDASIYDSRIYQLVLKGDAALRLSWGDNPLFIVSLGGFHPRFSPPPSLISVKRLSLSISQSSLLQIYCWTYQALTSNSLQFGAGVEFYAGAAGASIEGGMSFDALIYFNPFSFSIDMAGHLVARYKGFTLAGVYLSLGLSGPSPWNARGTATFEILFWDISVDFNVTWGPSDNERLPAIDPWLGSAADDIMGLQEALSLDSSWGSRLPAYANMFEALKEIEEVKTEEADPEQPPPPMRILMHPFSRLEIQQKVLPFNLHLDKLGNNPVRDHNDFRIESVVAHAGGSTLDLTVEPLLQDISRGQYKELNKIQRLTLPSFEKLQAGILAGSEMVYFAQNKSKHTELVFESILINPDLTSSQPDNPEKATAKWHDTKYQMRRNAIRQSGLVTAGKGKYATAKSSKIQIQQEGYYVVKTDDLSLIAFDQLTRYDPSWPDNDGNLTRVKADELADIYLQENSDEQVQIISAYEYEEAA